MGGANGKKKKKAFDHHKVSGPCGGQYGFIVDATDLAQRVNRSAAVAPAAAAFRCQGLHEVLSSTSLSFKGVSGPEIDQSFQYIYIYISSFTPGPLPGNGGE